MKYAAIVDGFSSGKLLLEQLTSLGIPCIHILSLLGKGSYNIPPEGYSAYFEFNDDYNKLLHGLIDYPIAAVFSGCEEGVEVAEKLASLLKLPTNNPDTSIFRRNKQLMQEKIAAAGILAIRQKVIVSTSDIEAAISSVGGFPVIIKPLSDGGSINVFKCDNIEQLHERCNRLLNSTNSMGEVITSILVQEMLIGEEYIVNTVTYDGKHYFTDMWQYKKTYISGGGVIATQVRLIDHEKRVDLANYVRSVLDALDITFGAAHTEVIQSRSGIQLIETGARLMGGGITKETWRKIISHSQIDAYISCQFEPEKLPTMQFKFLRHACLVLLPIYQSGKIKSLISMDELIKKLDSVSEAVQFVKIGDEVIASKDDRGPYFGFIFLISQFADVLEKDLVTIASLATSMITYTK